MSQSASAPVFPGEEFRETLRRQHGVRLVQGDEDGQGINRQPEGVYGFTYSPGIRDTPLFSRRGEYTFEVLKVQGGEVLLTGFVAPDTAARIRAGQECDVELFPVARDNAAEHVALPMSLVQKAKEQSTREGGSLQLKLEAR